MDKLACCWLAAADAAPTELGVELAAVMTPPVILNVVVPGLDKCPAAVTVLTEPSDSFTCAPWEPPTTCRKTKSSVTDQKIQPSTFFMCNRQQMY